MEIPCTCDPDSRLLRVDRAKLKRFQGNLKTLHKDQYGKLKASMQSKGFFAPIFVWAGHEFILDGHQRLNVLESEGWDVAGGVPVVEIEAADEKDAAEKLLLLSSTYGKVDPQGVYEFTSGLDIELSDWGLSDLPDFDIGAFDAEFGSIDDAFDDSGQAPSGGAQGVRSTVSFPPRVWLTQRAEIVRDLDAVLQEYGGQAEWAE